MTIPPAERDKIMAVALCGRRVVARLEQAGIERLDDLADRDPETVTRRSWSSP